MELGVPRRSPLLLICLALVSLNCAQAQDAQPALRLVDQGTTTYQIVGPTSPSPVDDYALDLLAKSLNQATGAAFTIITPDRLPADSRAIFVGLSEPARARLHASGQSPLSIKDQEHINQAIGSDLLLWGQGTHGNLYAVVLFLERSLGRQWYSPFELPQWPVQSTLALRDVFQRRSFSFSHRAIMLRYYDDFNYQMGKNMTFRRAVVMKDGQARLEPRGRFVNLMPNDVFVHSMLHYINPNPGPTHVKELDWNSYSETMDWLDRKDYFSTHPEYFTLNATGKRVKDMQLCLSHPDLRRELTRQILAHIALAGEDNIITVDAADNPDRFCFCDGCTALERKYQSPGGPLYDYLLELCALLQQQHPKVLVKTAAYRRAQTQAPPAAEALPAGRFPDNLIVSFAAIEDNFFADWDHPDPEIQQTLAHLHAWRKITTHLWAWFYPNPWGSGMYVPIGNIRRIAVNLRHLHRAGVTGVFIDHNGPITRSGWCELQMYLMNRLMQDIDCDVDAVVHQFTDHHYGSAGAIMRQYLDELEQQRLAMKSLPPRVTFKSRGFDERTFPYLTAINIHQWQQMFDEMERATRAEPVANLNVLQARRELDIATLTRWFDLKALAPASYADHTLVARRIEAVNARKAAAPGINILPLSRNLLDELITVIEAGGQCKPLPSPLNQFDANDVHQLLPVNTARTGKKLVVDPDGAMGYAATVDLPDMPLQVGFYQWLSRNPDTGAQGARIALQRQQIEPGKYQLHKLGLITVTPDCWIWFSARSWATHLQVGDRVYEPGEANQWVAWVSMKCDGPSYGGTAAQDVVLVDRIVLVAASAAGAMASGPAPLASATGGATPAAESAWRVVSANLLTGGDAEGQGPASGWTGLVQRNPDDAHGGNASLRMSSNNAMALAPQFVPIDPQKTYRLSGWLKSTDASHPARGLIDLRQHDDQQREILPWTVRPITTVGKLAGALARDNKTLRIDAADWSDEILAVDATLLAVELNADPGASLPAREALRLVRLEKANGVWVAQLRTPVEKPWPQGTPVRVHRYVDHPRAFSDQVPAQWTHYSVIIRPLPSSGIADRDTLWPGAALARVAVLVQNLSNEGAALLFDDLELVEVEK
jgi:hypothetical protein